MEFLLAFFLPTLDPAWNPDLSKRSNGDSDGDSDGGYGRHDGVGAACAEEYSIWCILHSPAPRQTPVISDR
jgi:hypothetical protein